MAPDSQAQKIQTRDRGGRAVRRLTLAAGALAVGLTGVLAAVTASAGRTTHAVVRRVTTATRTTRTIPAVPEPTATVSSGSPAVASSNSGATASAPAPSATGSAPVAVSGGS